MIQWSITSTLLLFVHFTRGNITMYVQANNEQQCPGNICADINYYAAGSILLESNSTLIFMLGNHTLTSVLVVSDLHNFNITTVMEQPVMVTCKGPAGLVFKDVNCLSLQGLTIQYCGIEYGTHRTSALRFESVSDLYLLNVHVRNSTGYGVVIKNVYGHSMITWSSFSFNHGFNTCGGNVFVEYTDCLPSPYPCFLEFLHSTCSFGSFDSCEDNITVATGLTVILSCSEIHVNIFNATLHNNTNHLGVGFGGNLFVHFLNHTSFISSHVTVQDCRLTRGFSGVGGGVAVTVYTEQTTHDKPRSFCNSTLTIADTVIAENSAVTGAGIFIEIVTAMSSYLTCPKTHLILQNITFNNNFLVPSSSIFYDYHGIAIHILNGYSRDFVYEVAALKVYVYDSIIQGSHYENDWQKFTNVAAIFAVKFLGDFILSNTVVVGNNVSGISLIRSKLFFENLNVIANNTGVNGGGLKMCESSYIILWYNTTLVFNGNHALQHGGAVYVEDTCSTHPTCFFQFPFKASCDDVPMIDVSECYNNSKVIMTNNTALYGGHDIFGGRVDTCNLHRTHHYVSSDIFYSIFNVSRNVPPHYSAVSSSPVKVCACESNKVFVYDCGTRAQNWTVYPGQTTSLPIVLVGQLEGTSPGIVTINNEMVFNVSSVSMCTDLHVPVQQCSPSDFNLTLRLEVLNEQSYFISNKQFTMGSAYLVYVTFKKCPAGFIIKNGSCECMEEIEMSFNCDINTLSIVRMGHGWIGYYHALEHLEPSLLFHMFCPFDYCHSGSVSIVCSDSGLDSDMQCSHHRSGLLCGACSKNYSIVMGSTECKNCRKQSNLYLMLIVFLYIVVYLMLVVLLFIFNISTSNGTLSGLLFYVNIVFSQKYIFSVNKNRILYVPLAWLNLDAGFSYCLYNGLDSYAKTWLEFLLPLLMWSMVGGVILVSKRSSKIATLLGNSPVRVLATLLELSYYKTIDTCINALSFTKIEFSQENGATFSKFVWLRDANVDYLRGKHLPLFVTAVLYSGLVILYTSMLLFVQPLQRYSHVHCCRWIHRVKPLLDAHTAPNVIKSQCRCWVGLLLFFRIALAVTFASNYSNKPQTNLAAIIVVCMLICATSAIFGGVYHSTALNFLNIFSVLNLAFLSLGIELLDYKHTVMGIAREEHLHTVLMWSSTSLVFCGFAVLACIPLYKNALKLINRAERQPLLELNDDTFLDSNGR